ncbi:hypothetical protein [Parabacteroides goldsteinii]|uniref:hypothetical protein n=1 Tax=Parabacteroides goldsteinii TaxID=328812 RepID=UPI0039949821
MKMKNWMKQIFSRIIRVAVFGAILSSCTNEMEQPAEPVAESIPVNISFDLRSPATKAVLPDTRLYTLRVIQVRDNIAGEIVRNIFIDLDVHPRPEFPLPLELMSGDCRVYVVVNEVMGPGEGDRDANLDTLRNYADLTKATLDFSKYLDYGYANFSQTNIPMFGQVMNVKIIPPSTESTETNTGMISVNGGPPENVLRVPVKRLLAYLQIHIPEPTVSQIRDEVDVALENMYQKIPLLGESEFKGNLGEPRRFMISSEVSPYLTEENSVFISAYSFSPRDDESKAVRLAIKKKRLEWGPKRSKPLGHNIDPASGDLDYTFHRNCMYSLSVNYDYKYDTIRTDMGMQWIDEEGIDAPLFESYLKVPGVVIMDKSLLGGTFSRKISYTSKSLGPVKIWVNGTEITGTDTSLPDCPAWLAVARLTRDSEGATEGEFTFTYQETAGDHSDYVITLQSGNITKQLRVKYENETP